MAPSDWAVCFQDECPLAASCLRHAVGLLVPSSVTSHNCVLPNARKDDDCRLFVHNEPVRIAYGMAKNMALGRNDVGKAVRQELFKLFGSRTHFYRYFNGEYPITPKQQQSVIAILKRYGINRAPFDTYTTEYCFA